MNTTTKPLTKAALAAILADELQQEKPPAKAKRDELEQQIQAIVDEAAEMLAAGADAMDDATRELYETHIAVGRTYGFATPEETAEEPEQEVIPPATAEQIDEEVGKAIALREEPLQPVSALPTPAEFNAVLAIAAQLAGTTFVPEAYRNRQEDVVAAIFFGREIGLGPMMSLRDIYMIDGRPSLAAHRQLALLRKGGVTILESEATKERCYIKAQRRDTGEIMAVDFTYEEAEKIQQKGKLLVDKANWRYYPKDMLWARTVGRLTRRLGPDMLGGLPPYVAEEVADFSEWGIEYNEGGQLAVQPADASTLPDLRKEYPDYNWPTGWAELLERLAENFASEDDAKEWIRQAVAAVYPGDGSIVALTQQQRKLMFRRCIGALAAIDGKGDLAFDKTLRTTVATAFAKYLDGTVLEGPPWRISPDEEDRPLKSEWNEQHEQEQKDAAERERRLAEADESDNVDPEVASDVGGYE